jgi:16S rRNA (cytidine1402-2'-O)-methyltransferase
MPGTLYLVATPIGNLEDITLRALRILKEVDLIAAEDTRQTRKLLSHFEISSPLTSHHDHSPEFAIQAILDKMAIGFELVRRAIASGVTIVPIPGASAPISALIASGLPTARFLFEGFLPRTKSTRVERIKTLSNEARTVIFFESPQRLVDTLGEIAEAFGSSRNGSVARELTKLHEEHFRAPLAQIITHYKEIPPRGECVIVVDGVPDGGKTDLAGLGSEAENATWKDLIKLLAKETGIDRRRLYQAVVDLKNEEE